jgi:hypothetical protein
MTFGPGLGVITFGTGLGGIVPLVSLGPGGPGFITTNFGRNRIDTRGWLRRLGLL